MPPTTRKQSITAKSKSNKKMMSPPSASKSKKMSSPPRRKSRVGSSGRSIRHAKVLLNCGGVELSPFQRRVYLALCQVPAGKVTTYKHLANKIGCNSSATIGQALLRNPYAPTVPCHRVIGCSRAVGSIGGGSGSKSPSKTNKKLFLLKAEGVRVQKDGTIHPGCIYEFPTDDDDELSMKVDNRDKTADQDPKSHGEQEDGESQPSLGVPATVVAVAVGDGEKDTSGVAVDDVACKDGENVEVEAMNVDSSEGVAAKKKSNPNNDGGDEQDDGGDEQDDAGSDGTLEEEEIVEMRERNTSTNLEAVVTKQGEEKSPDGKEDEEGQQSQPMLEDGVAGEESMDVDSSSGEVDDDRQNKGPDREKGDHKSQPTTAGVAESMDVDKSDDKQDETAKEDAACQKPTAVEDTSLAAAAFEVAQDVESQETLDESFFAVGKKGDSSSLLVEKTEEKAGAVNAVSGEVMEQPTREATEGTSSAPQTETMEITDIGKQ